VKFENTVGQIDKSRFEWKQIKTVHKQTKPYIPISSSYKLELKDGTTLTGILLEETDSEIKIQLEGLGILTIDRSKIQKLIPLEASNRYGVSSPPLCGEFINLFLSDTPLLCGGVVH